MLFGRYIFMCAFNKGFFFWRFVLIMLFGRYIFMCAFNKGFFFWCVCVCVCVCVCGDKLLIVPKA